MRRPISKAHEGAFHRKNRISSSNNDMTENMHDNYMFVLRRNGRFFKACSLCVQAVIYVLLKEKNKQLSNIPDMFTSPIPLYSSLQKVFPRCTLGNREGSIEVCWKLNCNIAMDNFVKHYQPSVFQ